MVTLVLQERDIDILVINTPELSVSTAPLKQHDRSNYASGSMYSSRDTLAFPFVVEACSTALDPTDGTVSTRSTLKRMLRPRKTDCSQFHGHSHPSMASFVGDLSSLLGWDTKPVEGAPPAELEGVDS